MARPTASAQCISLGTSRPAGRVVLVPHDDSAAGGTVSRPGRAQARYTALRRWLPTVARRSFCWSHHQRDQAETLLLQALRGAGTPACRASRAASSATASSGCDHGSIGPRAANRCLCAQTPSQAHRRRQQCRSARFARNRLRMQVWPALSAAFPQAETTLATAAQWAPGSARRARRAGARRSCACCWQRRIARCRLADAVTGAPKQRGACMGSDNRCGARRSTRAW